MSLLRLAHAGFVLAREGAFGLVDPEPLPLLPRTAVKIGRRLERRGAADRDKAERLTAALNRLGPSWVKLGQFLATRPDLVGGEIAIGLGQLRDQIAPFPRSEAVAVVERAFKEPLSSLYLDFSEPVAAASIAQVHRARVIAGGIEQDMAVKVLRPGIRHRFARDLRTFFAGARWIERIDPASRRLRPLAVVDRLARSVTLEMDLRLEAAALAEVSDYMADEPGFRVPQVDWQRTARDVLTLEWIDGIKLSRVEELKAAGHDLPRLAERLMQIFLRQAIRDGFFHADLHQGNLFVEPDGTIVAVDFGIMGRLTKAERRFLAEILYGFLKRDYLRIAEVHREAGYVPARHSTSDFAQALRAIGEPIHRLPAKDISMARLLTQLFEVTEMFDMETRPELLLLQKTMVVVEGVARSLDPDFDMWSASEPVLVEWAGRNVGPIGMLEDAVEGIGSLGRLITRLPELGERAERLSRELAELSERGVRIDPDSVAVAGRTGAFSGPWSRAALWVIAAALVVVALVQLR
jgi:ubiquinone biosynthesis protein